MGNYVFTTDALLEALRADAEDGDSRPRHGRLDHPALVADAARRPSTTSRQHRARARTERDHGYWRDVGTIDAYYDAHMRPGLRASRSSTSTTSAGRSAPLPRSCRRPSSCEGGIAQDSMVGAGTIICGGDRAQLGDQPGRADRARAPRCPDWC